LFAFAEAGYKRLVGVDYSEASTALARSIAVARGFSSQERRDDDDGGDDSSADQSPVFVTGDVLASDPITHVNVAATADATPLLWHLVTDKGTYDAVCLSDEKSTTDPSKRIGELYPAAISRLLAPGGIFLITSCQSRPGVR
jgi:hypothetical protein